MYNAELWLEECINSAINQTYNDYEIIIVNDGSSDNSLHICDYFASINKNCFVWHQENGGLSVTRSTLVDKAKGEYCVFLDADDCLTPNALELLDKTITLYDEPDCVMFGLERVLNGASLGVSSDSQELLLFDKLSLYKKVLSSDSYNSVCRKCTKTNLLRQFDVRPYANIHMGEDLIRSLFIYKECKSVLFIKDVLYLYRMNPTSITHTVEEDNFQPSFLLAKLVFEFLEQENVYDPDIILGIRTLYAQKMIRDILTVERFHIARKKKLRIIRNIVSESEDIVHNPINSCQLRRRHFIFDKACEGKYSLVLLYSKIENKLCQFVNGR